MDEAEIATTLSKGAWWDEDSEDILPEWEYVFAFLKRVKDSCGLLALDMEGTELVFRTARPLTPSLAFELGGLTRPDEVNGGEFIQDNETQFRIQWKRIW